jgi:MSHA pilin protein MshC
MNIPPVIKDSNGFTMIELIAVLVILGVLTAVAAPKLIDSGAGSVTSKATIVSHIRYAQILAMKSDTGCGIRFNGSSYWVFRNNTVTERVTFPGGDNEFTISSDLGTATEVIYFDTWGSPNTSADLNSDRATGVIGTLGLTMTTDTGFVQ